MRYIYTAHAERKKQKESDFWQVRRQAPGSGTEQAREDGAENRIRR